MRLNRKISEELAKLAVGDIFVSEPLRNHCTWRIGGPADLLVEPRSFEQLSQLRRYINKHKIASIVIGEGSNLLFDDAGFRGVVVKIGHSLSALNIDGTRVQAEAGIAVPRLARAVGLAGLTGIEHIIGIPGTLGGLIVMNGGSRRKSVGEVVRMVEAMDCHGEIHGISHEECGFSYRRSVFQESDWLVTRAKLELEYGDASAIRGEMLGVLRERRRKFPRRLPNCGSVFASTVEMFSKVGPPGKVIEEAGLKGLTAGGAQVSRKHANFIVNMGNAMAKDVCELIRQIRKKVHGNTNFWMPCEVKYVCCDGTVKAAHEVV